MLAGACPAVGVARNAGVGGRIGVLIGVAGLDTLGSALEEPSSAVDAVVAGVDTAIALGIAGLTLSINSKEVGRAGPDA